MAATLRPLTDRDIQVLRNLSSIFVDEPRKWLTTMDAGGSNRSHHSATLAKLCKRGLAQWKPRGGSEESIGKKFFASRGSKVWRITEEGVALLTEMYGPRKTRAEWNAWWAVEEAERKARKAARASAETAQ
jgi:hypothetical protein